MSPIPPSLTAGALAPFRPEVRPPPPRVPKPIPEDRFYARPQPAPAAAPSSLPPKAAATHAPPVPRAQMAELGTQKVAVAELARRQLQRPPAGTGRTWHMTLKVTVPVPLYLKCVPHPPSARQSAECPRLHHLSTPPPPQARDCGLGRGGGHAEGRHGMGDDLADSPRQGAGFLVREQGGCTKPLAYKSCKIIAPCKEKPSEMLACVVSACADLAQGGHGPTRDNRVQPGLLHAGTCARSCPPSPLLTIVSVLL